MTRRTTRTAQLPSRVVFFVSKYERFSDPEKRERKKRNLNANLLAPFGIAVIFALCSYQVGWREGVLFGGMLAIGLASIMLYEALVQDR